MPTEYLSVDELAKLLQNIPNLRDRLLTQFLYESGCSISEASALKTSAVHGDGTVLLADRRAFISPELASALLAQAASYIFHTRQTPTITPKRIQQILKPYLAAVHKGKITPHVLRYTHIAHAYRQGLTIAAISTQTGLTAVRIAQIVADISGQKNYQNFFRGKGGRP